MPITQQLNSKANVKKYTNNDLPFSPQQPVIASYYATSTAGQTSIANLGFSVDQSFTDTFLLYVDGKLLRLGASNDYIFAAVAADNTSSAITLNQPLALGLNIQAFKLGLKKESEFGVDNRFTTAYEWADKSFQGWVNQSTLMTPTTTTGTPAAGTFYSSITGRASMVDLSQDLKPRMGIERMSWLQPVLLPNESGSNNEQIFGILNDTFGQVRLIGNWTSVIGSTGTRLRANNVADLAEITFYGTGLNLLVDYANYLFTSATYSVDGGSNQTVVGTSGSAILQSRNVNTNQVLPIVAGLTLGIHTVKILIQTSDVYGCEILNESSSLKINPGVTYIQGKKGTTSAQSVQSYNATFESGALGTKGGRVVTYQKADGTIAKAVTPTNTSQGNLASADHTNEEVARSYSPREFGAGRNDDFSLGTTAANRAFTLDDGTTTLTGLNARFPFTTFQDAVNFGQSATTDVLILTFVGTGLDISWISDGTSTGIQVNVDGANIGTIGSMAVANTFKMQKVVSGLTYGTHIVRFASQNLTSSVAINRFIVYQPRKPSVPAGAVELADYNVCGNYLTSGAAGNEQIAQGVLRKANIKEWTYVNTWTASAVDVTNYVTGFETFTSTNGAYFEYTFFGTGFELRGRANTAWSATNTLSLQSLSTGGSLQTLNSTNFPGLTTGNFGGFTFTYASGNLSLAASNTLGSGMSVSGLTLGLYKVRLTSGTANNVSIDAFDVITPIHSHKSNIFADLQNSLPVGSNGISDNRKTTPSKDVLPSQKAWTQAIGITNDPTTTSSTPTPMPDMSVTVKTSGGPLEITYGVEVQQTGAGNTTVLTLFVDGQVAYFGYLKDCTHTAAGQRIVVSDLVIVPVNAGFHKVDLFWNAGGGAGTSSATGTRRNIMAREI